ncbi:hypothetical protein [Streptomyces graminilatus]|uniref:hypothetical protein n=1 Tax=Streptomyces graminilatus TaxID=1464070 RepID=UPI0006E217B1|nr:hypothetical protein [Streptomyces graminilatus]
MRGIRVASAALLGVASLALTGFTAPAAQAAVASGGGTSFGFGVEPSTVAAGGQVTLRVENCDHHARVSSGVFDPVTIPKGHSSATAEVDWDARPGASYRVTFTCGDESGHTELTIAGGHSGDQTHHPAPVPQGVQAGEGGSVAGFDLKEIGLGAALITGSLAVAYRFSRRRPGDDSA